VDTATLNGSVRILSVGLQKINLQRHRNLRHFMNWLTFAVLNTGERRICAAKESPCRYSSTASRFAEN